MDKPRYRLKLQKLDFISIVDEPAQQSAKCLLIKRAPQGDKVTATARVVKVSDELGLAFFWAFTSTNPDGSDHYDLQGDCIESESFIKACAEFMENGGPADQQHDSSTIGKTVFAMPMTPEIAAAFGVVTKTSGLMVAIRPSKAVLAKLKSGDYTGVSIAGLGERIPLGKTAKAAASMACTSCGKFAAAGLQQCPSCNGPMTKRALFPRVLKRAVLTSEADGHQHSIDLDDPAQPWSSSGLSTSYATAEGATQGHSHAWTFDATTGAVTIAADSGHTHDVADVVSAVTLAAAAAIDAAEQQAAVTTAIGDEPSDGIPAPVTDEESSGKTVVVIQARAISTPTEPIGKVNSNSKETQMTDAEITSLTKRAERAERLATLTDAHRAHFAKLAPSDAEAFAAKSHSERETVLADIAKADEVVYVSKSDGTSYRKSDDPRLVAMAKREDERAILLAKAVEDAHVARLTKRASDELGHLPGDVVAKVALLRAVDGIADEAVRKAATEVLKAGDAAMSGGYAPTGTASVAPEGANPAAAQLSVAVTKYMTDHKLPSYELALMDATAKDPAIRELWNASLSI